MYSRSSSSSFYPGCNPPACWEESGSGGGKVKDKEKPGACHSSSDWHQHR